MTKAQNFIVSLYLKQVFLLQRAFIIYNYDGLI